MKKCLFFLFLLLGVAGSVVGQTVSGSILSSATQAPLVGATVTLRPLKEKTLTNADGYFVFQNVPEGVYQLQINSLDYEESLIAVSVGKTDVSISTIYAMPSAQVAGVALEELIPIINLEGEGDDAGLGDQNISGLLTASRDPFFNAAAFTFGPARFRIRGYNAEYTQVFLNGMPVNDLETGQVFWSSWGGLNDVTRYQDNILGLAPIDFNFGGIGGASQIDTRASSQRKQIRVSYSLANRNYRNRLMATYSTGLSPSGWALTLSGSRRWAEEGYVPGTFFDGWSYFGSLDKKAGKHLFNLTALGTPTSFGRYNAGTKELYELAGTNYYNSDWGFQNGKKRNADVSTIHEPRIIFRHDWTPKAGQTLTTSLGYHFGRNGRTGIDWFDAADPRPDYYRYLPSYWAEIDSVTAPGIQRDILLGTKEGLQINWNDLYFANRNSTLDQKYPGLVPTGASGQWSQYILQSTHRDPRTFSFNSVYQDNTNDVFGLSIGLNHVAQNVRNYREVADLLGGDYYVNVDKFAVRDSVGNPTSQQFDLTNPNALLQEGDRLGFDYSLLSQRSELWSKLAWVYPDWEFFMAGSVSYLSFQREGFFQHGKFPDNSLGKSERQYFADFGVKTGITYKLNGRNYLVANGAYQTRPPSLDIAYVSARTRDNLLPGLTHETITALEGGYQLRSPNFKGRAMFYYTQFENQVEVLRFFNSFTRAFGNFFTKEIDKVHYGTELALQAKLFAGLSATAVAAIGTNRYAGNPLASIYQDNTNELLTTENDFELYLQNYHAGNGPEQAYTFALNYSSPRFWFANVNFNYFDANYLSVNPLRRTTDAVFNLDPKADQFRNILDQEKLPAAFTVDFFGGKSFKFGEDLFLYLNVGVNNVLNNLDFITGGFEQLQFDAADRDPSRFPARYFYAPGTNYFINISFRY